MQGLALYPGTPAPFPFSGTASAVIPSGCTIELRKDNSCGGPAQVQVTGLVLMPDGTINPFQFLSSSADFQTSDTFPAPVGQILHGTIRATPVAPAMPGGTWVEVRLWYGFPSTGTLVGMLGAGYVGAQTPVPLGPGPWNNPMNLDRCTVATNYTGTAAGANADFQFSQWAWAQIESIRFQFTTSATVANRNVQLTFCDSTGQEREIASYTGNQTASLTWTYFFGLRPANSQQSGTDINVYMRPICMPPNFRLRTKVTNIQAGDQVGDVQVNGKWFPIMTA